MHTDITLQAIKDNLKAKITALDMSIAQEKAERDPLTRLIAKWDTRREAFAEALDLVETLIAA